MKPVSLIVLVGCAGAPAAPSKPAAPIVAAPIPATTSIQLASWTTIDTRDLGPAMAVASTRPERCSLRVTAKGVTVDGDPVSTDDAIAMCSHRSAVLVELGEGADPAIWQSIDRAFLKANVPVLMRGTRGQPVPSQDNPLGQ